MSRKILIAGFLYFLVLQAVQGQSTAADDAIYEAFKNNQFKFPPPPRPYDTIYVGEWNANNSEEFTGTKGGVVDPHDAIRTTTRLPGITYSFSPKHYLKFRVKNSSSGFYVKVAGITYQSQPGHNDLFIDVKDNKLIDWKIGSGIAWYADKLSIIKKPIVAAGVFTVPFMPLLLLYEPPPNNDLINPARVNIAMYSRLKSIGISSSISLTDERNRTTTEVSDIDKFKGMLKLAGSAIGQIDDPTAKATAAVIEKLSDDRLWGGKTTETTKGTIKEKEISFDLSEMFSHTLTTDVPSGGPGFGDIIYVLPDCKFLWMTYDGKLYTTMLSSLAPEWFTARSIKDSIAFGQRKNTFLALSKFNPFISAGPTVNLANIPNRYEFLEYESITMNDDGSFEGATKRETKNSDRNTFVEYTSIIEDTKAGLLSYVNLSPFSESQIIKTILTTKNSNTITRRDISRAEFKVYNDSHVRRTFYVYYDKLFGTFALQDPTTVSVLTTHPGSLYIKTKPKKVINTDNTIKLKKGK